MEIKKWSNSTSLFLLAISLQCTDESELPAKCKIEPELLADEKTFQGDVIINNQADLDSFGIQHYTKVNGNVLIGGVAGLCPLGHLQQVTGDFRIGYYSFVFSDPEQNMPVVTSVGNHALFTIDGLDNLDTVGGDFEIFDSQISSVDPLANLTYVGGGINVTSNPLLQNVNGFSGLSNSIQHLVIKSNPALENINGLSGIREIGNLLILENASLVNLGLSNLKSIEGVVLIKSNSSLVDLSGLSKLETIGYDLRFELNPSLENFNGFTNLVSVGHTLYVLKNTALKNLNGFSKLTTISQALSIQDNNSLLNVDGFSNLTSIGRSLYIESNSSLTSLLGFSKLAQLPLQFASVEIINNPSIQDVTGFLNLTTLYTLKISQNTSLINLDGFSGMRELTYLDITNNVILNDLCGLTNINVIQDFAYVVTGNSHNPTREQLVTEQCRP